MKARTLLATALLATVMLAGCADNGRAQDSDGDTLKDSTETDGWIVTVTYMESKQRYQSTSDPNMFDTDGDGVSDFDEFFRGLDPRKVDTDDDGLTDCQELFHSVRLECEDPNFAGTEDGGTNTDPALADSDPRRSLYAGTFIQFDDQTDTLPLGRPGTGDGISDGEEFNGYNVTLPNGAVRFVKTNPRHIDTDGDRLDDGYERFLGTDPLISDSDGDGCGDGQDAFPNQHTTYSPGLASFTLKPESGYTGTIDVRIDALLVDSFVYAPSQDGSFQATTGESVDVSNMESASVAVNTNYCNYAVANSWARVEIIAYATGTDGRRLDTSSISEGDHTLWWNLRDNVFAREREGTPVAVPYLMEGVDAAVSFSPVAHQSSV